MSRERQFIISQPDDGALAGIVKIKIPTESVDNAYCILELELAPNEGAPLHVHHREDEIFHVIEGICTIQMGEDFEDIEAGSLVILPKGKPHAFRNNTSQPAKILITAVPGGLDGYFLALDKLESEDESELNEMIEALNTTCQIEFLPNIPLA